MRATNNDEMQTHPYELFFFVEARQQDDRHAEQIMRRDSARIRCIRLEHYLVAADLKGHTQHDTIVDRG